MKKYVSLLCTLALLLAMGGTALAAVSEPEVYWDGNSAASGRIYDYDLADGQPGR